jgi:hypothetical protein
LVYRRRAPPKSITPSEDDLWLQLLHEEVGKAMAQHLKRAVNLERQIKSLSLADLRGLAAAAEAAWIQLVVKRLASERAPVSDKERQAYTALLMG